MGKIGANSENMRAVDIHSLGSCSDSQGASPSTKRDTVPGDSHVRVGLAEPDCRGQDFEPFKIRLFIEAKRLLQEVPSLLFVLVQGKEQQRLRDCSREKSGIPERLPCFRTVFQKREPKTVSISPSPWPGSCTNSSCSKHLLNSHCARYCAQGAAEAGL